MVNAIDLFCGCGGMTQGMVDAGIDVLAGIDNCSAAMDSYSENFDHEAICANLCEFGPEEMAAKINMHHVDMIIGGPPCQGYSMAGRRNVGDPRNSLFAEFCKYITYFQPKVFIMENVFGILSMKTTEGEKCIDIIMQKLEDGYNCKVNRLYASDFDVPQNRPRVIIIGVREDLDINPPPILPLYTKDERPPVGPVLLDKSDVPDKMYLSKRAIAGINTKRARMKSRNCGFGAQFLNPDKPSYTIPARYWKDGYDALVYYSDSEIRRLTTLELKRIQTFPDDYTLCGNRRAQIEQIGNAVPPKFAYHIAQYVLNSSTIFCKKIHLNHTYTLLKIIPL